MSRQYKKLVRDKIPEIIRANGKEPITRILNDEEYLKELIKKLHEETDEFAAQPSLEELADIQEVLYALLKSMGFTKEDLERLGHDKTTTRGGFNKRVFLESVE